MDDTEYFKEWVYRINDTHVVVCRRESEIYPKHKGKCMKKKNKILITNGLL
jgi:hypothetical protein